MASICGVESTEPKQPSGGEKAGTVIDDLPKEVKECLVEKSLCTLMSMSQNKPKFKSTLENALGPCTVVAPYMSPLDALAAANEASDRPAVSVDVPHAKKRVYTELETVKQASDERLALTKIEGRRYDLAPQESDIEKEIVDNAVGWLHGDPEGTEESLVVRLVKRCEKKADCSRLVLEKLQKAGHVKLDDLGGMVYLLPSAAGKSGQNPGPSRPSNARDRVLRLLHDCPPSSRPSTVAQFLEYVQPVCNVWFTVAPARFFGMSMKRIKHRRVKDENKDEASTQTLTQTVVKQPRGQPVKQQFDSYEPESKSESESKPRRKTKFAIGVQPGENIIRERVNITPNGLTGIGVSVTGQATPGPPPKRPKVSPARRPGNPQRMRAVGQSKSLSGFFKGRLTVAVRGHNAVLVPANDQEKKNILSKVTEWVCSNRRCTTPTDQPVSSNPPRQTVPKLQQELANMCVGKVRRLTRSTIVDLLQSSGYISIDDDRRVVYHLPDDRGGKRNSWQQQTVETAVKSCRFSRLLKQAFPRRIKGKGKGGKRNKPKANLNIKAKSQSHTASAAVLKDNAGLGDEDPDDEDGDYDEGDNDYDVVDDDRFVMHDFDDHDIEDYAGEDPDYDDFF